MRRMLVGAACLALLVLIVTPLASDATKRRTSSASKTIPSRVGSRNDSLRPHRKPPSTIGRRTTRPSPNSSGKAKTSAL